MKKSDKIYLCGHRGMMGTNLLASLVSKGYDNIIYRTSEQLDLRSQNEVEFFFKTERPKYVFLIAAKVGGLKSNLENKFDFLVDNTLIEFNVILSALKFNVEKLLFVGSSTIYPYKEIDNLKESDLLTGIFDKDFEGYALAKIAGIKLIEYANQKFNKNYISLIAGNLYGENDNFDLNNARVVAAAINKVHKAKTNNSAFVEIWGSGFQQRQFLNVNDFTEACIYFMKFVTSHNLINISASNATTIKDLYIVIKKIVGYDGEFVFSEENPEGISRKVMSTKLAEKYGWTPKISLEEGLKKTYFWYTRNH